MKYRLLICGCATCGCACSTHIGRGQIATCADHSTVFDGVDAVCGNRLFYLEPKGNFRPDPEKTDDPKDRSERNGLARHA